MTDYLEKKKAMADPVEFTATIAIVVDRSWFGAPDEYEAGLKVLRERVEDALRLAFPPYRPDDPFLVLDSFEPWSSD